VRVGRLGPDLNFSWEDFARRYEADLSNSWGNLLSRVLTMIGRWRDGVAPAPGAPGAGDDDLRDAAAAALEAVQAGIDEVGLADALEVLWRFLGRANAYVESTEPWRLAKDSSGAARLDTVLNLLLESLRVTAVLVSPVVPGAAARTWAQLGLPASPCDGPLHETGVFGVFPAGTAVKRGDVLFPRVEDAVTDGGAPPAG